MICKSLNKSFILFKLVSKLIVRSLAAPNADENAQLQELSFIVGGNTQWSKSLGKTVWRFLSKLTIFFPCESAITLLSIYSEGLKNRSTQTLHTKVYSAFIIIAKSWKQLRCLSEGEWIDKWWYIPTMDYYLVLNINDLSSHGKTWRKLKCIFLSERRPSEKAMNCMLPTMWCSKRGKQWRQ